VSSGQAVGAAAAAAAPTSPVFEADGFVIRAWQHPSSLRSPPKVNDKFANAFPVTDLGFSASRPQPQVLQRDLWPAASEGQGAAAPGAPAGSAGAAAEADPPPRAAGSAVAVAVGQAAPSPTPREVYRQRQRWIRTYAEHSSELRTCAPRLEEAEQEPLAHDAAPPANPEHPVDRFETPAVATVPADEVAQGEAHAHRAQASQATATVSDASTQTETMQRDSVSCQTEQAHATVPEEAQPSASAPLSATEQLAALDGKSPSMAELDRLERLLQAEHRKIMGDLAVLPEEPAPASSVDPAQDAVHREWLDQQAVEARAPQQHNDVLRSTHEEWLAQTAAPHPPPAEPVLRGSMDGVTARVLPSSQATGVEAEVHAANDLVAQRMEAEMAAQLHTGSYTVAGPGDDLYAMEKSDLFATMPTGVTVTTAAQDYAQTEGQTEVKARSNAETDRAAEEAHMHAREVPDTATLAATRMSRRVPMHEAAAAACVGTEQQQHQQHQHQQHQQPPGSPSAESDGSGSAGMGGAQTSLESLAELEALLEEQHKQLIARGLIPADTPNGGHLQL
jgi:1,2-phenylacetyl-CoA epoxidase PaaB subunit